MSQVDLRAGPPPISAALVEWLEAVYPNQLPSRLPHEAREDFYTRIDHSGGIQEVVRLLRDHLSHQTRATPTKA